MNNNICKFKKHFEEPKEKYVCFSTVLFYKEKYIKTTRNTKSKGDLKVVNLAKNKIKSFIFHITETIKKFIDGTFPDNFYLRLYYDKSLFKLKIYEKLFKTLKEKKNKRIQLVEYECETFKNSKNNHIDLFGTLMRFYSIFDPESVNMEYCILIDADSNYGNNFIKVFNDFKKSNKLVYTVSKLTQIPFHSNDFMNNKNELMNYIYLLAGLVYIRRDPIFDIKYWKLYFDKMFEQNDLTYIYNYLDFKRFYMGLKIKFNNLPQSYSSFFYGTDEIWLNYVLKKILIDNNQEDKIGCYYTKDYDPSFVLIKFKEFLEYAYERNFEQLNLFIKNCDFLGDIKERNYENFNSFINKFLDKKNFKNKKNNSNKILQFFKNIRKNKYFNRFYLQSNIRYFINHHEELIKMRNDLYFNQILLT